MSKASTANNHSLDGSLFSERQKHQQHTKDLFSHAFGYCDTDTMILKVRRRIDETIYNHKVQECFDKTGKEKWCQHEALDNV